MRYGISTDYQWAEKNKTDRLTIWSGEFSSEFEGEAISLPKRDGYMVRLDRFDVVKVRVTCPVGRTDENYREIDDAINAAINTALSNA